MRIGIKILMSFLVIIISITVMGYTTVSSSQEKIIDEIGGNYAETLHVAIEKIDDDFKDKAFGLITSSNRLFVIEFLNDYSTSSDSSIKNNALSVKLRATSNALESKYGYPVFEDALIANSSGDIVAYAVDHDVPLGDMPWWDIVVDNGVFVDDVVSNENSKISTRDVMIRIDDYDGNFIGILKSKINLQPILFDINDLKQTKNFKNSEISLVTGTGYIVFSTNPNEVGSFIPAVDGIIMLADTTNYFIRTGIMGTDSVLHAYSKSNPTDDFPILDWALVVKQDGGEILGPVIGLTNTILIISVTTILSAVVVANYVRTSISQPLIKLKNASSQIAAGDFNVKLDIKSDDEVGELANKFELMRDNVHFTNENLRDLIKMRTTDLKTALDDLKNNELWTDELIAFVSKKFQSPIESIFKNINLIRDEKISQNEALQLIEDTTSQLKILCGDFMDLYNIEKNKTQYDMADVSINKIIKDTISHFEKTPTPNVKLESILSDDVKIFADASRMKRVLSSHIEDSLKSTKSGFVKIESGLTSDKKNLEIKISDSRGEIDGELYDLFGPLKQPNSTENDFSLILSKSIITEHAGDFEISKSGSGLIVSIKLPIFEDK
jgi:signal transduction histidine kinase